MKYTFVALGYGFYTNNKLLKKWLTEQFDKHSILAVNDTSENIAKDSIEMEENLDRLFPGVHAAAKEAMKDLWDRYKFGCLSLVYMNGIMQAWAPDWERDSNGLPPPPSRLCPNKHLFPNL